MFTNKFDRYKILYFLVANFFKKLNIPRKEFQKKIDLSVSLISHLFSFKYAERILSKEAGTAEQKPYSLETLEKACEIFGLSDSRREAMIWLLEGGADDPYKKRKVLQMLDEIATIEFNKTNDNLAKSIAKSKQNVSPFKKIEVEIAGTKGFFDSHFANKTFQDNSETLQKRLYQMSSRLGHRMVVSKFPTSATHPEEIKKQLTEDGKKRVIQFQNNIRATGCGERHIHSKPTIKRYLEEHSKSSFLGIEDRRKHIEILIKMLSDNRYPNFQVALSDHEPEIELAMRSIDVVVIRTTSREIMLSDNPFACGPSYLFIHDPITVLSCYLDFEREWSLIPEKFRQKQTVIKWLEETLENSKTQKRRETDRK